MIVQIYEATEPHEAWSLAQAGVDHVGVLVGRGTYPREVPPQRARAIFEALPLGTHSAALSLSPDLQEILGLADCIRPDIIHIGTLPEHLPPESMPLLRKRLPSTKIMRSIPVQGERALEIAKRFAETADLLLLDSYADGDTQIGATGAVHDWSVSRRIVKAVNVPVILAGGLGPDNVGRAIAQVRPQGVDSKTKTDRYGSHRKDLELVRELVLAARSASF
jgi:phosphoribosylanthranilate isomerase